MNPKICLDESQTQLAALEKEFNDTVEQIDRLILHKEELHTRVRSMKSHVMECVVLHDQWTALQDRFRQQEQSILQQMNCIQETKKHEHKH